MRSVHCDIQVQGVYELVNYALLSRMNNKQPQIRHIQITKVYFFYKNNSIQNKANVFNNHMAFRHHLTQNLMELFMTHTQ